MSLLLSAAVPEIPVTSVEMALAYYVGTLGFRLDWGDEPGGIAGISRGDCRLFLTSRDFRSTYNNVGPIVIWVNLASKAEVDALFAEWQGAGAQIIDEVADKPWNLREFVVADPDGNLVRVFYDFAWELK